MEVDARGCKLRCDWAPDFQVASRRNDYLKGVANAQSLGWILTEFLVGINTYYIITGFRRVG